MKILILSEGDAEAWDSWSGITTSLIATLRSRGHTVIAGDIDLYGWSRRIAMALSFSPNLQRWRSGYHLGAAAFRLRTRNARRLIRMHPDAELILQIGATFTPEGARAPYALYCDSNFRMAEYGAEYGFSDAVPLTAAQKAAVHRRERGVYENAACVFAISGRLRRSFIEDIGLPADRVHAIHAGPNFSAEELRQAELPKEAHPPTVLFVGRQFDRKGGDVLLRAFRRVRARVPEAELVIVGPDKALASEPGVSWQGRLDRRTPEGAAALLRAYRNADVFCLPTRFEPFGIVFLEAMFFGLACVGTDAWAVPEMIADGETGFTVPINDDVALADRLTRLLTDPALTRQLGQAGRERAQVYFTWPAVVSRLLHGLAQVAPDLVAAESE